MITENPKLKYVHIGGERWACGAQKARHMVIYSPDGKQHHVYDKDVEYICTDEDDYGDMRLGNVNRGGNCAIQEKLKIYILTSILDKAENWSFDLRYIPDTDRLKIIYNNGTVKNVKFNRKFEPTSIPKKHNGVTYRMKTIIPVGYRKLL